MSTCNVCELHAESTFKIEGMDCHEEVAILETRLKRLAGLEALDADVMSQRLRIKYDAAKLSASTIAEAVAQTGMRAWLEHEEPAPTASASNRQRLVVASGAGLVAGLFLTEVLGLTGAPSWLPFLAAVGFGGVHTVRRALVSARAGSLDINVLMVVAVLGAMALGQWSEGASVVFLFALAQLLEARAMDRARGAIRALMDLAPSDALVRRGGQELTLGGRRRRRRRGGAARREDPARRTCGAGTSHVNQAPVIGVASVDRIPATSVFAGTINGRARRNLDPAVPGLTPPISSISSSGRRRSAPPSQTFVDRFARVYTPAVPAVAVLVAGAAARGRRRVGTWFYRSLVLLVIRARARS